MATGPVDAREVYHLVNDLDEFYGRHRQHLPDDLALKISEVQVALTKFELQLTIQELDEAFTSTDSHTLQEA